MKRREIRALIREQGFWYQGIHFGFLLDTKSSARYFARRLLRHRSKEEMLLACLPDVSGRRVIDVGCNAGLHTLECSVRGAADVLGVEMNEQLLRQAKTVERIYRGMGRPVGSVRFQNVDVMKNLDLLEDRDLLIACCVLYHLGPLEPLQEAIAKSPIDTLVLQGNTVRCNADGSRGKDVVHQEIAGIDGMTRFAEAIGFRVESVGDHRQFPVVVARRT